MVYQVYMQSVKYVRSLPRVSFYTLLTIIGSSYLLIVGAAMLIITRSDSEHWYRLYADKLSVSIFTLCGFLLFWFCDKMLSRKSWNMLFESEQVRLHPTTKESSKDDAFLQRPWNCHSSILLSSSGLGMVLDVVNSNCSCVAPYVGLCFGTLLFTLGFLSYGWWGSNLEPFWHADNRFMEYVVAALATLFLVSSESISDNNGVFLIIITILVREWQTKDSLVPGAMEQMFFLALACAFILMYNKPCSFNLFFSGISLTIVGLICKSADWMKGWEKGTAVFHLLTAASFYVFWIWTQSVSNILH